MTGGKLAKQDSSINAGIITNPVFRANLIKANSNQLQAIY